MVAADTLGLSRPSRHPLRKELETRPRRRGCLTMPGMGLMPIRCPATVSQADGMRRLSVQEEFSEYFPSMAMLNRNEIVWQIVASIPKGQVATYSQIARLAGYPNHARYVGFILKNMPEDTTLPWHRVVNAQGRISFAPGSEAYDRQRSLLEAEGIVFDGMKLRLSTYGWRA